MKEVEEKTSFLESFYKACRKIMNAGAFFGLLLMALDPSLGSDQLYLATKEAAIVPIFGIYFAYLVTGIFLSSSILSYLGKHYLDLIFFIPLLSMSFGGVHPAHILLLRQFVHYFDRYYNSHSFRNLASSISRKPARLFAFSFIGISLIGAFILVLPVSIAPGHQPSLLTAIFHIYICSMRNRANC